MELLRKVFSWKEIQSSHRLMLLIVLAIGLFNLFWGEKVPAAGGLGWDGVVYASMVRDLGTILSHHHLSGYYTQRIVPAAIVRGMLLALGAPMNNANIIRGFEVYNLILLSGACWAWKRMVSVHHLSLAGCWLGFSGIFINYECSKQSFYNPVLTDVTALFVAMLLLLFYVEKRPLALFFTTIIGAFSWPVVSVSGACLLFFMRTELPVNVVAPASASFITKETPILQLVKLGGLVFLALSIIGCIGIALASPRPDLACNLPAPLAHALLRLASECTQRRFFLGIERLLTALPSFVGMFLALFLLVGSIKFFRAVLVSIYRAQRTLVALSCAAFLVPFGVAKVLSNPDIANEGSLLQLILHALLPPEGKFFLPFVTLAVFWGPAMLLMIVCWKAFCVEARRLGPGVVAIMAMSMLLGLVGEPRFLTIGWPFFVLALVRTLERVRVNASFKYVFGALTIMYAQFWMRINVAPWSPSDYEGIQEYPKQIYFMHYGLWMNWWAYSFQLVALIISAIWLYKTMETKPAAD